MEAISKFFEDFKNLPLFDYIDFEIIILIFVVIALIIFFRCTSRFFSRHRVFKVIFISAIILGMFLWVFVYVRDNPEIFSFSSNFYVYGRVLRVVDYGEEVVINSIRTNFTNGGRGELTIKLPSNVNIQDKETGEKLKRNQIAVGDYIQIYCQERGVTDSKIPLNGLQVLKLK